MEPVCLCCPIECKYISFFFFICYYFICWKSVAKHITALWGPLFRVSVDLLPPVQSLARGKLQLQLKRGCVLLYTTIHGDTMATFFPIQTSRTHIQHRTHHTCEEPPYRGFWIIVERERRNMLDLTPVISCPAPGWLQDKHHSGESKRLYGWLSLQRVGLKTPLPPHSVNQGVSIAI